MDYRAVSFLLTSPLKCIAEQEGHAGGLIGLIALISLIDAPIWPFLGLSILPNPPFGKRTSAVKLVTLDRDRSQRFTDDIFEQRVCVCVELTLKYLTGP
jgi:hypothetical protein